MSSVRYDQIENVSSRTRCLSGPPGGETKFGTDAGTMNDEWQLDEVDNSLFLSVVIPAKNEAASLSQLIDEIALALRPVTETERRVLDAFEIVVVDDTSTDHTQLVLSDLRAAYPELRTFRLTNGAGQSAATMAGIRNARGNWIATLDADLQNDPADLLHLWLALPGHDVVLGWRVKRQDEWSKRAISYWANFIRNLALGQSIRDTGCSVRIFPRSVALRLPTFNGMHRFLGPLLLREGCRLLQVPVRHRPRAHGRSHYNFLNRLFQVVIDLFGVMWLMKQPLHCQAVPQSGFLGDDSTNKVTSCVPVPR